ncbi:unnamed protein product [Vicia faba]|uniref:Uncharacterized protein n=1 Tax=Vicia faba TaxID=3906 RepID=A0AAV0ZWE2_VICFA|nr:unnamed protein product [Vicia faba]
MGTNIVVTNTCTNTNNVVAEGTNIVVTNTNNDGADHESTKFIDAHNFNQIVTQLYETGHESEATKLIGFYLRIERGYLIEAGYLSEYIDDGHFRSSYSESNNTQSVATPDTTIVATADTVCAS